MFDFHLIINCIDSVSPHSGVHLEHMFVACPQGVGSPLLSPPQLSQGMAPLALALGNSHHINDRTIEDKTTSNPLTSPLCVVLEP